MTPDAPEMPTMRRCFTMDKLFGGARSQVSSPAERARHDLLRFVHDAREVGLVFERFGVDLVDVFRPGRPRGEPAVLRDYLQPADARIVARSLRELGGDLVAGEFSGSHGFRCELLERGLLFGRCRGIDAGVAGCAELGGE